MTRFLISLGLLCRAAIGWSAEADRPDVASLRLVPFPKEIRWEPGEFELGGELVFGVPPGQEQVLGEGLNDELRRAGLGPVRVGAVAGAAGWWRVGREPEPAPASLPERDAGPESYVLEIGPAEIVCAAGDSAGLFYGLQTLRQLIRANRRGAALPCLAIRDRPLLRWRCFQDDMTRGPSSTLATLRFEAGTGAYLKFNLMTFYMEYQYAFRKHPLIGPADGSLTPAELAELVAFVEPLPLDILGNQQSFGHFGRILAHPEYAHLRETPDVLTPVREETYQLLDDLYSEVCPLLPFPWFNVCCDETWGLGTGPAKELADQIGVGGVYVRHIRRVHDLLAQKHGKRMMMWGDIILQHPDRLGEVPKDTIMLTWGYDARPSFEDQIIPFARSGYEFFVCPGVSNWSRILPDFGVATVNIGNFVRDGLKHGAIGMLNTDWEDDGEAINAVKWHADAWAAECAWNGAVTPIELFDRRAGAVLFGERGDHFGQAVELLAGAHRLPGMDAMFNRRFWKADFAPQAPAAEIEATAGALLAIVRPAIEHLRACRAEATANQHVLDAYLFGARRMERIGLRMLDGLEAARLYARAAAELAAGAGQGTSNAAEAPAALLARAESLARQNREAHDALGREFSALWLGESKPYALDWTMARYAAVDRAYAELMDRLAAARRAAEAGEQLPPAGEIGLGLP